MLRRPFVYLIPGLLALTSFAFAEMKITVQQLRQFIESSIKFKHPDKQVADYLKQVSLTNKLDDSTVEDLQGLGAGPRTVDALKLLRDKSKDLAVPAPPPPKPVIKLPPTSVEQAQLLEDVTEYAKDYSKKLPNFICVQVTRRYGDPAGLEFWHLYDTVTAKLSYFEQKEDYKVILVNNRAVDNTIDRIGGATSSGEFGSMMQEIFEKSSHATFEWDRWATLRGNRMHVLAYRVPKEYSRWRIVYEKNDSIVPGYHGFIYVDRQTLAVMRITLDADDIPVSFPVQQAKTSLDYDFQDISGQQFVLPLRAEVRMRSGKMLIKNESEFRLYKKFGAEATITYTPDPLSDDKVKEQPPK